MSNSKTEYNNYVRANLPTGMTFDSVNARYRYNNHSFVTFWLAEWYYNYINKFSNTVAYSVLGLSPELVFDFDADKYFVNSRRSTFSDSVTHSASSNATMVDSDGLLKWRPHNLLTYSEQFDNAAWIKGLTTVTANATTAPDGAQTADSVAGDSGVGERRVYKSSLVPSTVGVSYTTTVYAKANGANWLVIRDDLAGYGDTSFDLINGAVGTVASGRTANIEDAGGGFYACTISVTVTGSFVAGQIMFCLADVNNGRATFSGDGVKGIYIWGAHIYRSDLGGMVNNPDRGDSYVPTTSAAVYLPRRGHHIYNGSAWVNEGLLHESEARTNLILNSETVEQKDVYVTNQEYTLSFKSGQQFRSELSETLGVTAVDVFVYDTTKDSDGGAWRTGSLAQASSWYTETLNTSTRGSRQEFPEVAVIVAEATKVTIYDGDDPSLPMWMVFNISNTIGSCSVYNGTVSLGMSTTGIIRIGFLDTTILRTISGSGGLQSTIWANTFSGSDFTTIDATKSIVNNAVNDVAMTVLTDAPTDPDTGLPVPTIAVATDGGVSVIKDDGTVVSGGELNSGWTVRGLFFDQDATLWATEGTAYSGLQRMAVPPFEFVASIGDPVNGGYGYPFYNPITSNTYGVPQNAPKLRQGNITSGQMMASFENSLAIANVNGISTVLHNSASQLTSLVNFTTSSYNTGWMNGDIKGAFLSDTDDTDLVGSGELVTNGDFATGDLTGWTDNSAGTGTATVNGSDQLELYRLDVSNRGIITQDITFTTGTQYVVTFTKVDSSANVQCKVGHVNPDTATNLGTITAAGQYSFTFSSTRYLHFLNVSNGTTAVIDNISVKLADEDRSVNNNGLIVNGTVTRTAVATGADLVAYSGFSASNYLEQPYNSDLDFGTGDFCVMGWVKTTGTTQALLRREDVPNTGARFGLEVSPTGLGRFFCGTDLVQTSNTVNSGQWVFLAAVRSGGVGYIYSNGVLAGSATASDDLDNTSAILRLGGRVDGTAVAYASSVSLVRISATAPTAEQIAKIYEDEKVLFQENAQATLYGSSDAVTALAHDPDTDLLHVGTSAGRSVFDGLRRIDNTTDAVTTAISASGGFILEQ